MSAAAARKPRSRAREAEGQDASPPSQRLRREKRGAPPDSAENAAVALAPRPGLREPEALAGQAQAAETAEAQGAQAPPLPCFATVGEGGCCLDAEQSDEEGDAARLLPQPPQASPLASADPTREPSPATDVGMCHIEWALDAQNAQARWAEAARARRECTERLLRLPLSDTRVLLDAVVAATVASSGIETTEEDGASAKALFAWALRAHAQIASRAAARATRTSSRRGARLSPTMVRSLWAASEKINCLLDTVDGD